MAIFSGLTISGGGLTISGGGGAPVATDPYFMYNSLLLPGNGTNNAQNNTFLDGSTNNFTLTRAGNTTQGSFSPYGGNWSNYFNGTGGNFLIAPTTSIQGSDFTIEGWFYTTNLGANKTIASDYQNSTNGWTIVLTTSNIISVSLSGDGVDISGSTVVNVNQWYHFALCGSGGTGSTIKLYLNGVQEGSTYSGSTALNSTQGTSIGQLRYLGSNYDPFYGYISNVRIVKGTAVYTSNFTPPTTPLTAITNTSLLTSQSNRLVDNSINNYTITLYGSVPVQRFSPFDPSSVTPTSYSGYFDGSGDYLTPTSSDAFAFGTGDFTVECWVYVPSVPSGEVGFVSTFNTGAGQGFILGTGSGGNAGKLHIGLGNGTGAGNFDLYDSVDLVANTWIHIAAVRSSGTVTLYKNGVSAGSGSGTNNIERTLLGVGISYPNSPQGYVTGYISNVRIVKGTAVYTSAFTPPTSPLTAISGTSLLTCQNTTFIDNSTNNFTITASGNSQPTIQNPFGSTSTATEGYSVSAIGGSGYFDGSGDYLSAPYSTLTTQWWTQNFTIEMWIYNRTNTVSGTDSVPLQLVHGISNAADTYWSFGTNASGQVQFYYYNGGTNWVTSTATAPLSTWNHIAMVYTHSSGNISVYLNGTSVASATKAGTPQNNATSTVNIGVAQNTYYNGSISNLRIVSGTTVYTSNFVPPLAPVTAVTNTSLLANMTNAGVYDVAMISDLETIGTAVLSTSVQKFSGSNSMSFPSASSNGAYMKFKTPQPFLFGTGDFTVEMWVNESASNDYALYIGDWSSSTGRSAWGLARTNQLEGPSKLYFFAGTIYTTLGAAWAPTTNTWYHIAVCRSGSSLKLFVDGTQIGSTFTFADAIDNTYGSGSFYINNSNNNGGWGMQGYISNLRVTSGYARYTSNFSVPTEAFPTY